MGFIKDLIVFITSLEVYLLLPVIFFIIGLILKVHISKNIESSIKIAIGFLGLFIIMDYFIETLTPVIETIAKTQIDKTSTLDIGWPIFASIAWEFEWTPLLFLIIIAFNILLILVKHVSVLNLDIFNYWHFIFTGIIAYHITGNKVIALVIVILTEYFTLLVADLSANDLEKFSGLEHVAIGTFSSNTYYLLSTFIDPLFDRIKYIKDINIHPEVLEKKMGVLSKPYFISFVFATILSIISKLSIKEAFTFSVKVAACIYFIPMMIGILIEGIMIITNRLSSLAKKHLKNGQIKIGMDLAIILKDDRVISLGILLIPIIIIFSFILPGISFIPIGDLTNLMFIFALLLAGFKGNIFRTLITVIPIMVANLYISNSLIPLYTDIVKNYATKSYSIELTSAIAGGNPFRYAVYLASKDSIFGYVLLAAFILTPLIVKLMRQAQQK